MSKLYTASTLLLLGALGCSTASAQLAFDKEQYQKALWMTTRFYGAQRSGYGPNWLLANHLPTNVSSQYLQYADQAQKGISYIKDADDDGYDLTGGWWDCADYVKFGQTNYYSAYMLLLGYSEFPSGFGDYYSADYNGYIGSDDYTWEGKAGVPNGIPDILDEVKYATDYFIKCMRSSNQFYYQVGDGTPDHKVWCTAVMKAVMPNSLGGELNGSRTVFSTNGKGTSMVAFCGASLAAMSRLYRQYDAAYADLCLEKAKVAYEYIRTHRKANIGADGGFYGAKPTYESDCCCLCIELHRATGDMQYLYDMYDAENGYTAFMYDSKKWSHWYTLGYNNTEDLAYYLMGNYCNDTLAQQHLKSMVYDLYMPKNGYILNVKNNKWGMLRYPANQAFVYGLYKKMIGELDVIDPYALASIEYIMGSNSENYSFITGFGEKSPRAPHYRNIYLDDSNDMDACVISEKHAQLGYLVGGSFNPVYEDDINNYQSGEGGIDYNAGLVCALGYINSILNPTSIANVSSNTIQCYLYPNPTVDEVRLKTTESGKVKVSIFDVEGKCVKIVNTTWEDAAEGINVTNLKNGAYLLEATAANGKATKQFIKR